MYKAQACIFKRIEKDNRWQRGIAILKSFNDYSVLSIIDSETGYVIPTPYDYQLIAEPLAYCDPNYTSR